MEEKIRDLEAKLLHMVALQKRQHAIQTLDKRIGEYLSAIEDLDSKINAIDSRLGSYDLVDFLMERAGDMSMVGLEMVVSIMKDIKRASVQFEDDGSQEYLRRSEELWTKMRRTGFAKLNEMVYRSTESLAACPAFHEFVELLDEKTVQKVKVKILQLRRVECLRKAAYIRNNREFIFRSMLHQELQIFFGLFPEESERMRTRLRNFSEERGPETSTLFERFSLSILREYFRTCVPQDLEALRDQLDKKLRDSGEERGRGCLDSVALGQEEFLVDSLLFVAVRSYLSSDRHGVMQDGVVEM